MKKTSRKLGNAIVGACLVLVGAGAAAAATIDIAVTNTTPRAITGLYLSATTQSKWGPDNLNGTELAQGQSWVLPGVSCGQSTIVVVAEDETGCFAYQSFACSGNGTWTISSSTTRDCGR